MSIHDCFHRGDKLAQILRSIALAMKLPSPNHGAGNYFAPLCNGNHQVCVFV